jgi:hypothetical protein
MEKNIKKVIIEDKKIELCDRYVKKFQYMK